MLREGGSLSLVVDSSLASLNSLGSKPLRLDGILFLGEYLDCDDDEDADDPVQHYQYVRLHGFLLPSAPPPSL